MAAAVVLVCSWVDVEICVVYQHSPLRIGAVGTHVVGFLSKGLLRKAKPLVIFPGCGTRIEAIGLMFLGAKKNF